jgi:hypothetical protein
MSDAIDKLRSPLDAFPSDESEVVEIGRTVR